MAAVIGDTNATLKDLTRLVEDEIIETQDPIWPKICSDIESADEAYVKIPVATKVPFPVKFEGERQIQGKDVVLFQEYHKSTYALTMDFDSDLMREAKAYTMAETVQEGTISAKIFPSYNLTKMIIANGNAYDGKAFYANNHLWANAGSNTINNIVSKTGQTPVALANDLASALTKIRTFLDDKGRVLNPMAALGADQVVIHCPVALEIPFRHVLFNTSLPMTVPVTTSGTAAMTGDNQFRGLATLMPDAYLDAASTTTWYLHYIGRPQRPFVFSQSYGLIANVLGFNSEFETNTNRVRIALKHRFVEGFYRFDRSVQVS